MGWVCGALLVSNLGWNCGWASSSAWRVSEDFWLSARNGKTVLALPAVRQALQAWLASGQQSRLLIHYPGGEEGVFQARELHDWLVSFGVPSDAIEVLPGGGDAGQISIEWLPADAGFESLGDGSRL